jgi:hypothetical protein
MPAIPQEKHDAVVQGIMAGLKLRDIERSTGVHPSTITVIRREVCWRPKWKEDICRPIAQGERVRLYRQEIPLGMRLGTTCDVPYCGNPGHFVLVENKASGRRNFQEIRDQLCALDEDQYFDLPNEPTEEASVANLRCALETSRCPHFLIRTIPTGGVRIIRAGNWGDSRCSMLRKYPSLIVIAKPKNSLGSVWLGMLWGTWQTPEQVAVDKCSERGCVFPKIPGSSVCRAHWQWDQAVVSYPREQRLHYSAESFARKSDDRNVSFGYRDATFHSGWLGEDKYGFLDATTLTTSGNFVSRSKQERENDKWWKENVVDQGIEAPGVMVRKTSKELKAEMEAMIETSLQQYNTEQSSDAIHAFFRVANEPHPLRDDPFHPNAQRLKIGDGAAVSLRGKMRRGGGRAGIRKAQRKAGWTGHRNRHDPQYFTRDTIRGISDESLGQEDSWGDEMIDLTGTN